MSLSDSLASIPFRRLVWLLPITFALHEAEEWNIIPWYQAQFTNPPSTRDIAVYTWLAGISLVGFLWTGVACLLPTPRATARMALPFFVVFVFGNALQHVYWQLVFSAYAPGFLAALLLNIPFILLLSWHAFRNDLVGWRFLAVLYALSLPIFISTIAAGRTVPPTLHRIHEFSVWLANLLFGAA
jgi:hypothetical protein